MNAYSLARRMNRRELLFGSTAEAAEDKRDVLVVVFLRGGCDSLNFVSPLLPEDRRAYEEARPNLRLEAASLLPLDGRFGLHPSATGLKKLYDSKKLAIVAAAGMKAHNRSHFDAQAFIELGTPGTKGTPTGWLARHLQKGEPPNPLRALTVGPLAPASLLGCMEGAAVRSFQNFGKLGGSPDVLPDMIATMRRMSAGRDLVSQRTRAAMDAMEILGQFDESSVPPRTGADYPAGDVGPKLRTLAQLIKKNLGMQAATIDMGGWDTHRNQGKAEEGLFARQVEQLSLALHSFFHDLSTGEPNEPAKRVTVVVMTEFGRRLRENANRGTDHGHGGMMMVLGDNVNGGRVYGEWPGLKTEQLYERADLQVTTDFRLVLAEILRKRRRENNLAEIFPGFSLAAELGLARA